jgi:hypothetical protein
VRVLFLIGLLFLLTFYFSSCSLINLHHYPDNYIDSTLIGEWYYLDTTITEFYPPFVHFYGIQINPDHSRKSLGIETNSGKVEISTNPAIDTIISAYDGTITVKLCSGMVRGEVTYNYSMEGNKLTIGGDLYSQTYIRTNLNDQVYAPRVSDVSVMVDSVLMTNPKVTGVPSAFITPLDKTSNFVFGATLSSTRIEIVIDNLNGVGTYPILTHNARYSIWDFDVVWQASSDSSSANIFIVDEYDKENNKCSGRFAFDAYGILKKDTLRYKIRDGVFTVPIYRKN